MASEINIDKQYKRIPGKLNWYHWIVIALSLILTFTAWRIADRQVEARAEAQFSYQMTQLAEILRERMEKYEEALWAGSAALHAIDNEINRDTWKTFASSLKIELRYPGINGIGVIHYLETTEINDFIENLRLQSPTFDVHPAHTQNEFWPITYIEPESSNFRAIGLDMAHEQNRYQAAQKSRDTGTAQITAPIALVQDESSTPGFLFYVPWYASDEALSARDTDQFLGLVYAPFIMSRLMDGTLSNQNRQISFSIHDGNTVLYNELNDSNTVRDNNPMFTDSFTLPLYGRPWHFDVESNLLFRQQNNSAQPAAILIGGLVIDSLLLALFLVMARSNRLAVRHADKVTQHLRHNQQALKVAHDDLELRNFDLTEANKELDQFAFVASHDLKAPLRGIRQLSQWVEEDLEGTLDEQTHQHFALMRTRIGRMERLLDDLLSYSRAGRRDGNIQEVNLNQHVNELFQMQTPPEHIAFRYDGDVSTIDTLITPLDLIIRNLFSNAIKHHDKEQGQIIFTAEHKNGLYYFSVSDDGPGIPDKHQERVFDLFHTLKPRDQVEGSGLGLAIIKKILDRYRCDYRLESVDGEGTTFYFTWPEKEYFGRAQ